MATDHHLPAEPANATSTDAGLGLSKKAQGLGAAVAAVAAAFIIRLALQPWVDGRAPLILFTLPVLACGIHFGRASAGAAALLALLVGGYSFIRDGVLDGADAVQLLIFAAVCGGIIILSHRMMRAQRAETGERLHAETERARALRTAEEVTGLVAELERRERHLRSILDTVPDAMIVIDVGGKIISFSHASEEMFGYAEADLLGENVSTLMPSPDRERHDGYLQRHLRTGEPRIIGIGRVTTARRRDGSTFPIHLHIGETRVGEARLFTGFIQDLTERQQTEMRLHDLQSELAHVSRVTAMGTLATALAHELNQPLTAIANYVETARDLLEDPIPQTVKTVREALQECAAQSVRAGQIVRRLRDFISRGETERRVESLSRLVSEASALALVGAGERGIAVDVRLARAIDKVLVDRIQIQQVLLNLIRNAIEAMDGYVTRRLEISSRHHDGDFVEIVIADSGPGLPARVADRLFEPFVSTKTAGMGLGLSICHTIIAGHGGRIWAAPSPLGGTAFHFTLIDAGGGLDDRE